MTDHDKQTDPLEALLLEHIDVLNRTFKRKMEESGGTFYSYSSESAVLNTVMRAQGLCRSAIETYRRVRWENARDEP